MAKVNMKETEYYKSGKHLEQITMLRLKALDTHKKNFEIRIKTYSLNPKTCFKSNTALDYSKRKNKFCSHTCSATHNNSLRKPRAKLSKLKTSASMKKYRKENAKPPFTAIFHLCCHFCSDPFYSANKNKKTCSLQCQKDLQAKWLKTNRSHIKGNGQKSYMELSFAEWLNDNYSGRWYDEIHFYNKESKKHGWIDFVFPKEKLIIELDGSHHKKRKHLDDIRDEYLTRVRGYFVLRIPQSEYVKQTRLNEVCLLLNVVPPERVELP